MTTRERLRYLKENGFSITHIAKMVDCAVPTLTQYMKNERNISFRLERDVNIAVSEVLGQLCRFKRQEYGCNKMEEVK